MGAVSDADAGAMGDDFDAEASACGSASADGDGAQSSEHSATIHKVWLHGQGLVLPNVPCVCTQRKQTLTM